MQIDSGGPVAAWLPPAFGGLLALLCLWAALRARGRRRLLADTPTSKVAGVFIGFVEVKGYARAAEPIRSALAETDCVWYRWGVEEHWSRTVTESYTDAQGKRQTRTRTESGWTEVASGGEMIPFFLEDSTGVLLVRPEGARVEPVGVFSECCGRGDALYYGKGPATAVANSTHRRRFSESAIPVGARLYVVGCARERRDVVAPEIRADASAPIYLVSTRDEARVGRSYGLASWGWAALGLVLVAAGIAWREGMLGRPGPGAPLVEGAVAVGLYGLAGLGGWAWMVYNSMIGLRHRVSQGWSLVEVQLQRRADLIPNLVDCLKGYAGHEQALQEELAALRAQAAATAPGLPGADPHEVRTVVAAIRERYPALAAQEVFGRLQEELIHTEERIALARAYYNDLVAFFNVRRCVVPDAWIAALAGCREERPIEADGFERAPVKVELTR